MSKLCLKFEYYSHCDPYTTGNEMVSSIFLYVMIKICILWENVPMKNQWISSLSLKCESCLSVALACKLSVSFRMKKDLIWRINALQKTGTSYSHLLELLSSCASYQFMRVYSWTFKWTAFTLQKKWSFPLIL